MNASDEPGLDGFGEYVFDGDIVDEADLDTPALADQEDRRALTFLWGYASRCLEEDRDSNQSGMPLKQEAFWSVGDRLATHLHTSFASAVRCHPSRTDPTITDQVAMWRRIDFNTGGNGILSPVKSAD
jgi:hypothetical protein